MDISKIKNLVKQNGDKFIFVENGEPEVVMMSFGEYQKLVRSDPNLRMPSESPIKFYSHHSSDKFASFESPVEEETEFMGPVVAESAGLPVRLEDIRLEDLPI